ncbi:MAG TPA: KilA-N domain-containing protein [Syntrophorhabdaceae bacterium]|nr:KilA-N domain-containing protein [Syntrophorhabdaceae bacterium]
MKHRIINVQGNEITVIKTYDTDYISLTDMVRKFGSETILYNWLRNRNTIEFLGIWEQINNPGFNPVEFERFKNEAGLKSSTASL